MEREQWYTNKELFEQINALRMEMQETRNVIRKYNGLREEIGIMKEKITKMEAMQQGKSKVGEAIRNWGGWLFAFITLVVLLINQF